MPTTHPANDLDELQDQLRTAAASSFLKPQWYVGLYREVITIEGSEIIPADLIDSPEFDDYRDHVEGRPIAVYERRQGWLCRLSAPSNDDCTPWSACRTEREAMEHLLTELEG
jgi:hypothetical protein